MASKRWVVIDDADPSIKYTGSWFPDSPGSKDKVGNFGPPYLRTLHGTSADATVEFEFNGTAVGVWGTNIVKDFDTNLDPNFECFIDNVSIGRDDPFQFDENNWRYCMAPQLPDGLHTLRIDVKVLSKNQTFWLDQLRYVPSPDLPLDNQVILFDSIDPAIQYDLQWTDLGGIANMTTTKNSVAQVNFIGTSVSWVSFVPAGLPHTGATGTWAIDNGKPTQFLLPGLPANEPNPVYNQFFFTTPDVEAGAHTLTVTFLGDNQTTPLSIDFLYVKNGTFPLPTTTVNNTITPDPNTHDGHGSSPPGSNTGAILGGVLGGLAFLLIVAGTSLFWRRQRIREGERLITTEGSEHTLTPFYPHHHNRPNSMAQIHQPQSHVVLGVSPSKAPLLVPTPPAQQQPGVTGKQQGIFGRTAATHYTNNEVQQTGHPRAANSADTSAVRQHVDSGLRLSRQPVIDTPPHYTPD